MRSLTPVLLTFGSVGLLWLTACNPSPQATTPTSPAASLSPAASPVASPTIATSPTTKAPAKNTTTDSHDHSHGGQGGQIIETGVYHLELVTEKEAGRMHLDFYLQKGDNHDPVADAKVTGQVQLPDGSQQPLTFEYSADEKHYTAILTSTSPGTYKVAVLTDINGEKINGRFTVQQ